MDKILIVIIVIGGISEFTYKISPNYMIQYCPSAVTPNAYSQINFLNRRTGNYITFQPDGTKSYQTKVTNDVSAPAWGATDLELIEETFEIVETENSKLLREEQVQKMKQGLFGEAYVGLPKIALYGQDSLLNKYLIINGELETRTIPINYNKKYQKDFPFLLKTYTETENGEYVIEAIKAIEEGEFDEQDLYFIDLANKK